MDMETKIPVPTGISATNSSIGRWFKRVGEPVTIAEPLVEVESDNATVEVLAPATGILSEILLRDGQLVVGSTTLGSITEFGNGTAATRKQSAPAN
jgi:2-oxoglutarate dehydrogenase E2 component (dihydrolipoamide succinyltransferase)